MWLGRSSSAKRSLFQFISLHLKFFVLLTDLRKQPLIESHSQRLKIYIPGGGLLQIASELNGIVLLPPYVSSNLVVVFLP